MSADKKIPALLKQVFECMKAAKGDDLMAGLKEVNQFYGEVNQYVFGQMGSNSSESQGNAAASQQNRPEAKTPQSPAGKAAANQSRQPPQKNTPPAPSPNQSSAAQSNANGSAANTAAITKAASECGLTKLKDGDVAVCTNNIVVKQIPKFWTDKKVREKMEEFGPVARLDYKAFLNSAVASFKERKDAFKALSDLQKSPPLNVSWEVNSGIGNSYFKKYYDSGDGAAYIPPNIFPWMKQKDLLVGGAMLLDFSKHSAKDTGKNNASPANNSSQNQGRQPVGAANQNWQPSKQSPSNQNAKSGNQQAANRGNVSSGDSFKKPGDYQNTPHGRGGKNNSRNNNARNSKEQGGIPSLFENDLTGKNQQKQQQQQQNANNKNQKDGGRSGRNQQNQNSNAPNKSNQNSFSHKTRPFPGQGANKQSGGMHPIGASMQHRQGQSDNMQQMHNASTAGYQRPPAGMREQLNANRIDGPMSDAPFFGHQINDQGPYAPMLDSNQLINVNRNSDNGGMMHPAHNIKRHSAESVGSFPIESKRPRYDDINRSQPANYGQAMPNQYHAGPVRTSFQGRRSLETGADSYGMMDMPHPADVHQGFSGQQGLGQSFGPNTNARQFNLGRQQIGGPGHHQQQQQQMQHNSPAAAAPGMGRAPVVSRPFRF